MTLNELIKELQRIYFDNGNIVLEIDNKIIEIDSIKRDEYLDDFNNKHINYIIKGGKNG